VLAGPPGHALTRRATPITFAELRGAELLLLDEGHCFRNQALEVCSAARARESEFRATSLSTLVQMVASGTGVTLLPSLALAAEVPRSGLRVRPIASPSAHRTIAMVWRARSPLGNSLRELTAIVRAAYPPPAATGKPAKGRIR
jgi:LysR family hydrogen peroxide-inducible transcriptional activator